MPRSLTSSLELIKQFDQFVTTSKPYSPGVRVGDKIHNITA